MSNDKRQEMIKQFSTYACHFYQRCRINIWLAAENIYLNGMPELPLQGVNLDLANAKNQDTLKIKPGQVVKFVSHHCMLDVILSYGLLHIIGIWGNW